MTTRARVREITVDASGRVREAVYFNQEGNEQEELARVVVVCCNGVGTPRLLLNSTSNLFPNGLANSLGLVGRNFMIHPTRFIQGIFPERLDGHIGPMGVPLYLKAEKLMLDGGAWLGGGLRFRKLNGGIDRSKKGWVGSNERVARIALH